ncbi:MAG: cation transporter [Clostridia bacterium]|nr:cation transporter [Clostridia bacterium]
MYKTTLKIDGMACGMCEAHVNEAVRSAVKAKKVTSSYKTGECVIISDAPVDEDALRTALGKTGYRLISSLTEPYVKKKFSIFGK